MSEDVVLVDEDDIIETAREIGISEDDVKRALNKLKHYGDIDEPKPFESA